MLGTAEAHLVVDVHSYEFEVALGGATPREVERAILRPPNALRDAIEVLVAAEHPAAADQTVALVLESSAALGSSPRWKPEMELRSDAEGRVRAVLAHDASPGRFYRFVVAP